MPDRIFGKLLYLAELHHWKPEKHAGEFPSSDGNTEILLDHSYPYLPGAVSDTDAAALADALESCLRKEASGIHEELYFKGIGLLKLARQGGFEVLVLADTQSSVRAHAAALAFLRCPAGRLATS